MQLYRIISETNVEQFPNYVDNNGVIYTNEAARTLALESGDWHPLHISEPPLTPEGAILIKHYHLDGDFIVLDWRVITPIENVDANIE